MTTLRLVRWAAWLSVAMVAGLAALLLVLGTQPDGAGGRGRIGGSWALASATGEIVRSESLRGRPYALFFGFTQCPDVCPTSMLELSQLLKNLDGGPLAARARDFRVYFVTVDPERDVADLLRDYLSAFDPRLIGLIPTAEQLPEIARQHAAYYKRVPTSTGYTMDHTASVYLFDARGVWAGTLDLHGGALSDARAKLERLLRG